MEHDKKFIEELAKKYKTTPQKISNILEEYGTMEAYLEERKKGIEEVAFETFKPSLKRFFETLGIKSIEDLRKYNKRELKELGITKAQMDRLEKDYNITFRDDENEGELSNSSSLLDLGFTARVNQILLSNNIRTVEDLLKVSEEELQDLLYDKKGRAGKAGYDTMKKVLDTRSELSESFGSTELETLRAKKLELTAQSKGLEEQTKEAKELLTSYENLAKGTTQSDDSSSPDFKDE